MEKIKGRPRIHDIVETDMTRRLSSTRQRLQLTQGRMAAYLGVPVTTYSAWEVGRRSPAASALRLLEVLGTVEALAPQVHAALMP